jgi:addiction module RelB/DinJ family antitoxin
MFPQLRIFVEQTMAQASPEIRFRIDRDERAQFEQIAKRLGLEANEMMKVFIRRAIAAGGFPFEMRVPANDAHLPAERFAPVHGVPLAHLSDLGARAAQTVHAAHVQAGRLPPSSDPSGTDR